MKKAFLQIRIKEEDQDVLRFRWIKDLDPNQIIAYRFTRALFGMNQWLTSSCGGGKSKKEAMQTAKRTMIEILHGGFLTQR